MFRGTLGGSDAGLEPVVLDDMSQVTETVSLFSAADQSALADPVMAEEFPQLSLEEIEQVLSAASE